MNRAAGRSRGRKKKKRGGRRGRGGGPPRDGDEESPQERRQRRRRQFGRPADFEPAQANKPKGAPSDAADRAGVAAFVTPIALEDDAQVEEEVVVEYCPHCSFPIEFCEFSEQFDDDCSNHLAEVNPGLFAELQLLRETSPTKSVATRPRAQGSGGAASLVVIEISNRRKRKKVTSVSGLEKYDLNLKKLSRDLRRRFNCGVSTAAGDGQTGRTLNVTGDFAEEIRGMCVGDWGIDADSVKVEDKTAS